MGSDEEPRPNPMMDWIQGHLIASAFIAIGLVVVVGLLLASLGGDDPGDEAASATTTFMSGVDTTTGQVEATDDPNRPDVPPIDCRTLLTDDEVDEALFGGGELSGPRGYFTFAQGETCLHEPDDDSGHYIQIEPGDPSDFEPGAQLSGVFAESVDGVGDGARWFDDDTDLGILSVGASIEDASIIYRIHVGRDDLDRAQRLEQATQLALLALPRFPGTEPGAPEPLVDLCELVTDQEAEAILDGYRDAHPATQDEVLVTDNFSDMVDLAEEGDANCSKLILAEIYIETQQGSMSDFEPGAALEGIAGEAVTGVGDEAVWFADVPYQGSFTAPHERGMLAVRAGDAFFRIVIAVPDTPATEQLEIVRGLATGALSRIPGVPVPEQEPEVVTFDEDPPSLPPEDLYELVYDGVENGEWTEAEGLVQALGWMLDGSSGFAEQELVDQSGTALLEAARAYAAGDGEDAAAVAALVDEVIITREEIEQSLVPADAFTSRLMVSALPIAQESPDQCVSGESCWQEVPLDEYDDIDLERFAAFVDGRSLWEPDSVAVDAFHDAVVKFEQLGGMPPTTLALRIGTTTHSYFEPEGGGECTVFVGDAWVGGNTEDLLQSVAQETAHCFIDFDLFPQLYENPTPWLEQGLAVHLGGVVYPTLNVEHKALPGLLAQEELYTVMTERKSTNWLFFEYLHSQSNADAVMNLMRGLPENGDLAAALAGVPNIPEVFHDLSRAMSDSQVPDIGGGNVPYGPNSWQVILASPKTFDRELSQFDTNRYRLEVPSGRYACDVTVTSSGAEVSWRSGAPGVPGDWSEDVPDTLEGDSVLLVTSAAEGASFSFEAAKVGDDPECEEEEEEVGGGDIIGPILDLCEEICDPSSYYWGPIQFG